MFADLLVSYSVGVVFFLFLFGWTKLEENREWLACVVAVVWPLFLLYLAVYIVCLTIYFAGFKSRIILTNILVEFKAKRLCEREIFQNDRGTVTSLMSKSEFGAAQGEQFLTETFDGSLPRFLAAFTRRKKLSEKEIKEIQKLIDDHREVHQ